MKICKINNEINEKHKKLKKQVAGCLDLIKSSAFLNGNKIFLKLCFPSFVF